MTKELEETNGGAGEGGEGERGNNHSIISDSLIDSCQSTSIEKKLTVNSELAGESRMQLDQNGGSTSGQNGGSTSGQNGGSTSGQNGGSTSGQMKTNGFKSNIKEEEEEEEELSISFDRFHEESNGVSFQSTPQSTFEQQATTTTATTSQTSNRSAEQPVRRATGPPAGNRSTEQPQPSRCRETIENIPPMQVMSVESRKMKETGQSGQQGSRTGHSQLTTGQRRSTEDGQRGQMMNREPAQPNGGDSPENVDLIRIHCVIERLNNEDMMTSPEMEEKRDLVLDAETSVSGSLPFQDLVETVLIRNGFHWIDIIGAHGFLLPSCAWQPISMETVTRDRQATVRDVISGLERTLTLKIIIQKSIKKKNLINELRLKDLLLRNLLSLIPIEVFESLNCPLDKSSLERLRSSRPLRDLTDELLDSLSDWSFRSRDAKDHQSIQDHDDPQRKREEAVSNRCENPSSLSSVDKTKTDSEFSSLENWFRGRTQRHPSTELTGYLEVVNTERLVRDEAVWTRDDLSDWFLNARTGSSLSNRTSGKSHWNFERPFSNWDRKRRRLNTDLELDLEQEHPCVPLLPNRNAVYVVQPLPLENIDLENVEVVKPPSETDRPPSSSSLDSSARDASPSEPLNYADGKSSSDENHNNCSAVPLTDRPTDLSLASRRKLAANRSPTDWKPVTKGPQHPSLWPVRKIEKTSPGDYELISSSPSPSPKATTDAIVQSLHCSMSAPFLYPHYPVAWIPPIPPNPTQLATMSQLFRQSAVFYNPSQSIFPASSSAAPSTAAYDHDDHSSSPGSNPCDLERRKRSRVFIDPNTEIPRLEEWYRQDTHPSALQIEQYTNELNIADYRQRFPRLETKNIQLWFKNHRAKVKRLANDDDSNGYFKVIADEESFALNTSTFST